MENNIYECFNSYIIKARSLPLIDVLEKIRSQLMERMHVNLTNMLKVEDIICPRIRKRLESSKFMAKECSLKLAVSGTFEGLQVDTSGNATRGGFGRGDRVGRCGRHGRGGVVGMGVEQD
ncbi:hypothetical protein GH714_000329 [Hevea brasiliensis]|uniref:Uncharacterized protein n=1 Tax=Hevea brasiliensis TaxID=3981 RepID=A0A6A6KVH3_HEVBR|nr:hypothetical protein GH714_000329 [Hevea brasiliensis]